MPKSFAQTSTKKSRSYLERLRFRAEMATSFVAKYIANIRLVILLVLTISLLGITSFLSLPHRLNPEVKIPIVSVVTVLPGAGPADVESLVTIPIEDKLQSLKDVDTMTSVSRENVSLTMIQFLSKVDRDKAKDDVQSLVDSVNDLPSDAQTPSVTALDFEDQPVLTFALTSTKSYPDLMRTAKELRDQLEDVTKVDRVETSGFDKQEVVVEMSPLKLSEYGLNPLMVSQQLKKARGSYPAGSVVTNDNVFALTIDPSIQTLEDIRALKISVRGTTLALSDIASVSLRSQADHENAYVAKKDKPATEAVTFYVYKTLDSDIDDAGKDVQSALTQFTSQHGSEYEITTLMDTSHEISKQFTDLLGEFRSTILLVFVTLLLFLGLRQAVISSLTVPLTFLSAFIFMQVTGMSINFLSLFALLLALGLLIDDTIVTVSAMTTYYKTGRFTPLQTGILVWRDTIVPIWSTTITTIWSFLPLLLASGIIGEFIKPIPVVITVTMLSSTGIAVLITLPIMIVLLKPTIPQRVKTLAQIVVGLGLFAGITFAFWGNPLLPAIIPIAVLIAFVGWKWRLRLQQRTREIFRAHKSKSIVMKARNAVFHAVALFWRVSQKGLIDVEPFAAKYKRFIQRVLQSKASRRSVIIGVVAYAVLSFALLPLGLVKSEFFPKSNANELFVQVQMPSGTKSEIVQEKGKALLEQLKNTPETEFVSMEIGRSLGGFGNTSSGKDSLLFSLRLTDSEERKTSSMEIAEDLRTQFADYQDGKLSVVEESGGPPAGSDLQITFLGEDSAVINEYANQVVTFLEGLPSTTNIEKSIQSGTSKVVFVPDAQKLAENGLTPDSLGLSLRLFASGFTLDSFQLPENGSEKQDIVFRMSSNDASLADIGQLPITTPTGKTLPLLALGTLESRVNPTSITRESHKRSISVSAAVRPGFTATEENKKLEAYAKDLKLETGYEWKTGGVNEENTKSVQSILQAMMVSAVLILITMVIQFQSFRQAVIVLIVIPLAVSSVFLVFALTGTPLSFPALIGVLSLFGIVVTNSMFIVDKINLNRNEGMDFEEAIADAGASRMEPIILTKLCTVFGLLPVTLADPLWRGLGGAIISGLLIASTIMLLFIPVLYYSWMKSEK